MDRPPDPTRRSDERLIESPVRSRAPRRRPGTDIGGEPDARTRILDAAELLFADGGYEATATAQIAKTADVPKGLVFHYFPRKIDVLIALVDERIGIEAPVEDPADAAPGDPADALARLARRGPLRASPAMRRILFREADTHGSVRDRLRHLNAEMIRRASFALGLTMPGTRGDAARLEAAAATFAAVLLYQENLCLLTGQHIDPDLVADLIVKALT